MTAEQVFTWAIQAAMAVVLVLGKVALADRDRRVSTMEDRMGALAAKLALAEIAAARAEAQQTSIMDTLARIERMVDRLADRVETRGSRPALHGPRE